MLNRSLLPAVLFFVCYLFIFGSCGCLWLVCLFVCVSFSFASVVVSPDAGGVYRAKKFREGLAHRYGLDAGLAMIIKQRAKANEVCDQATDQAASEVQQQ